MIENAIQAGLRQARSHAEGAAAQDPCCPSLLGTPDHYCLPALKRDDFKAFCNPSAN